MRGLVAAAVLLAAAGLGGCGGIAPSSPAAEAAIGALTGARADATDEQVAATIGDAIRACVSRDSAAELRGACMAMAVSGVVEEMAFRVVRYDDQDAAQAIGHIAKLRRVIERFETPDPLFVNTDLRLATLAVADVLYRVARDRVLRDVVLFATADIRGGLTRARVAGEQLLLAEAMAADAKVAMANYRSGFWTAAEIRAAALARIVRNEERIGIVNEAAP